MKLIFKVVFLSTLISNCARDNKIDTKTYFLDYVERLPNKDILMLDTLSSEQNKIIKKYKLGVSIPNNFKSIVDDKDKECFIFFNLVDSSVILARCFDYNDSVHNQIKRSEKYNSPIYGEDYNDLSEFQHFIECKNKLTDSIMDPFLFGGFESNFLGAEIVMQQEFYPKSNKYKYGEFKILIDEKKYLFICSLHNGYSDTFNNEEGYTPRWLAFRFGKD